LYLIFINNHFIKKNKIIYY